MIGLHGIYFVVNRLMAYSSSLYFWRKGKKTGRRRYYTVAIVVYAASWLAIGAAAITLWRHHR